MALVGGSIPVGATFAPTGGTARTLKSLGSDKSSIKLLVDDSSAYNVRTTIDVSTVEAAANASYPGGQTPNKRRASMKVPRVLADGTVFTDSISIELIAHPETSSANITAMLSGGINMLNDSDFSDLWQNGSKS